MIRRILILIQPHQIELRLINKCVVGGVSI